MESLLLDQFIGRTTYEEIQKIRTEIYYSKLTQLSSDDYLYYPYRFPLRCHPSGINALDLETQEFRFLLSGGSDSSIKLWSVPDPESQTLDDDDDTVTNKTVIKEMLEIPRRTGHMYGVSSIKWWTQDNGLFVSGSFDQKVKVWDTETLEDVYTFELDSKIYDIDVSKTGQHSLVATLNESSLIRLVDLNSTLTSQTLKAHKGKILLVKWSPTNPYILASGGVDGELKVWDIRRAKSCVCSLDQFNVAQENNGVDDVPSNITVSPLKKRRVKDISTVKYKFDDQALKSHNGTINSILFNDLGDLLMSSGNDEKIKVWDLKPEKGSNMLINFGPIVKNKYPQRLNPCLSPISETETSFLWFPNDNGEILVFDSENGKLVKRLNQYYGHRKPIEGSSFLNSRVTSIVYGGKNNATYYSGSLDGKISIWGPDLHDSAPNFKNTVDYLEDDESGYAGNDDVNVNIPDEIHHEMELKKIMRDNPFS